MTEIAETAHKDLAFLKALVTEGPKAQRSAGELFMVAGIAYSLQCLLNGLQIVFQWPWPPLAFLLLGSVPTVIFLAWIPWLAWRNRGEAQNSGVATRAFGAAFTGAGLANISMCVVFGWVSYTESNFLIWLLYPAVVAALQGACWYVAWMIRRRLWLAAVSAGWFATAIAVGFLLRDLPSYLFLFALALFVLMAVPGYIMMRKEAAA